MIMTTAKPVQKAMRTMRVVDRGDRGLGGSLDVGVVGHSWLMEPNVDLLSLFWSSNSKAAPASSLSFGELAFQYWGVMADLIPYRMKGKQTTCL